jgi:hypothetical protein
VDEHLVTPGAGFDWHAHRGVDIVSLVVAGSLRHEGSGGEVVVVAGGGVLVQRTGGGIRHRETNASDTEWLRFVQITLVAVEVACEPARMAVLPVRVGAATIDVHPLDAGPSDAPPSGTDVLERRATDVAPHAVSLARGDFANGAGAFCLAVPAEGGARTAADLLTITWPQR